MLLGGPHPLQNKVPLKDACTNNKGPKQFSRVSNTCSMKMTNHQSWFTSMEQFRNVLFKRNCVLFSLFHWNSILSSSTQWFCLVQLISRNARQWSSWEPVSHKVIAVYSLGGSVRKNSLFLCLLYYVFNQQSSVHQASTIISQYFHIIQ